MFSYVFMKILESRPERYDLGIDIATAGRAKKIREGIVKTYVRPDMKVLDVGCGTGELIVNSASSGAQAAGIDISDGMLAVARRRLRTSGLSDKVSLYHAGVIEMDNLFEDSSFDLVTSTLLISELYPDERRWALSEIRRILKPHGTFVLAGEVMPHRAAQRLFYLLVRLPLALLTYLISQSSTKAVPDIAGELYQAGFEIINENRSFLGSLSLISARKIVNFEPQEQKTAAVMTPKDDFSILKSVWDYIGRWFPNPVAPGLRKTGTPDEDSPVIVTSNFHLSVRCVEKALRDLNCYILVAPTNGINVWCAACAHEMSAHSIISVLKTSKINKRVSHRRLILPQLCAPGVSAELINRQTGWNPCFGPVYAKDIPRFIDRNFVKSPRERMARFPLAFRLEILFSMNFLVFALIAMVAFLMNPEYLAYVAALFWIPGVILYAGYPFIPGGSGWAKAAALAVAETLGIGIFSVFALGVAWWSHWRWMACASLMTLWLGFDLRGSVGGVSSEAEAFVHRLGVKSLGPFFSAKGKKIGVVQKDASKCIGCQACVEVCPSRVFAVSGSGEVILHNQGACFGCNACVTQCPTASLSIKQDAVFVVDGKGCQ